MTGYKETYIVDSEPPEVEKARLNGQHEVVVSNLGYLLPPTVSQKGLTAIAEVATGTGIWLEQLSKILPSNVSLHGYDISSRFFPDSAKLPPNLRFSELNILEPVPKSMHEQYDVVHLRGLCMVLKTGEWDGVVKNVAKMLKPGGHIVWTDTDPGSGQAVPATPTATKTSGVFPHICQMRGGDTFPMQNLPTHLAANNLALGYYMRIPGSNLKPDTIDTFSDIFVVSLLSFMSYMAKNDVPNEWFTPETFPEFARSFQKELEGPDGTRMVFDLVSLAAQKR